MNISKIQIFYLIVSLGFFVLMITLMFYGMSSKDQGNNDVIKQELANLEETGETTILKAEMNNLEFILRLKYEDSRRHPFFEEQLAEQWGFNSEVYSIFVLEIVNNKVALTENETDSEMIDKDNSANKKIADDNEKDKSDKKTPKDKSEKTGNSQKTNDSIEVFHLSKINLRLFPMNLRNTDISIIKTPNATPQGKMEIGMQKSKITLPSGTKISKYIFFPGKVNFLKIREAKLFLKDGKEITLKPEKFSYAKPPTIS